MTTRREVLQMLPAATVAAASPLSAAGPPARAGAGTHPDALSFEPEPTQPLAPLSRLTIHARLPGRVIVRDGEHLIYFEAAIESSVELIVAGRLGTHSVSLHGNDRQLIDSRTFSVDCATSIVDQGGVFGGLLKDLYWTMCTDGPVSAMRYKDEVFTCWDTWLMDNTQTLKGMKYFWPDVKSNVDFYARSQREDGMIWENFEPRTTPESYWDTRFRYANFTRTAENGFLELRRAPVENHVEAFFLEALYFSWKASGDTTWMSGKLDAALRAAHYSMNDPYRWSTKYQLLKRGFTIDTWDFLCSSEAELVDNDIMRIVLGKTHFGVFFGDNTNFIAGLRRLSEMLDAATRTDEARHCRSQADDLEARLNRLSWNGEFFTHWIPEDPDLKLDLGVDITRQVALSNSYTLNRNATHEQAVAIIKTYQRIRREMPASSPGEFYSIFPPFERGFDAEDRKWEYVNGGVMSCVAGELARGAFDHGFEAYGADILVREKAVADRYRGVVPAILCGKAAEASRRTFTPVNLHEVVNAGFGRPENAPGSAGVPETDLPPIPVGQQVFREIPFEVIDPAQNERRGCLVVANAESYAKSATVPVHATARSFYLLHAKAGDDLAGRLTIRYSDGTKHTELMRARVNIGDWWAPSDYEFENRYGSEHPEHMQVAWRGANSKFGNIGVWVTGFTNPHPEKIIASLDLESFETNARWMILGVTLSDADVFLPPRNEISYGMPNNWGAAALVFALVEGLAGVKDTGKAFNKASICPRWSAAQVADARVAVRYPASRGYVCYHYIYEKAAQRIRLEVASSAAEASVAILLPAGLELRAARRDGNAIEAQIKRVETSQYMCAPLTTNGAHILELDLR